MGTNTRYIGHDTAWVTPQERLGGHVGYKVVSLVPRNGRIRVQPPHHPERMFELSDESRCDMGMRRHNFAECSCGFYAYNGLDAGIAHWREVCTGAANDMLVEVVLSGSVIVAEHGYRATHQRLTRVFLPPCFSCGTRGEVLAYHASGYLVPACRNCTAGYRVLEFTDFTQQHSPTGFAPIQLLPIVDFNVEIDQLRNGQQQVQSGRALIDQLAAAGKLSEIEQLLTYATRRLDEAVGLVG